MITCPAAYVTGFFASRFESRTLCALKGATHHGTLDRPWDALMKRLVKGSRVGVTLLDTIVPLSES